MKKIYFVLLIIFSAHHLVFAQSQAELNQFNTERLLINKKGMCVLGAWGLANLAAGATGYALTGAEVDKNFHQMNMFWGGINLALATVGYLGSAKDKKEYDLQQSFKQQQSIEKTFLLNAALDAVYITAGLYLTERAKNDTKNEARFKGYGQSIMLQGAFLLVFDAGMYVIENKHGNKKLNRFLEHVKLSSSGIGVGFKI